MVAADLEVKISKGEFFTTGIPSGKLNIAMGKFLSFPVNTIKMVYIYIYIYSMAMLVYSIES